MQIHRKSLFLLRAVTDVLLLLLSFAFSITFLFSTELFFISKYQLLIVLVTGIWFFYAKNLGLYDEFRSRSFLFELTLLLQFIFLIGVSTVVLIFILGTSDLNRSFLLMFLGSLFSLLTIVRLIFRFALERLRSKGRNSRSLIIIGAGEIGTQFYNQIIHNPNFGYRVVGFLDDFEKPHLNGEHLGGIAKLDEILKNQHIDDVIIALPNYAAERIEDVISICERYPTRVKIIPDYFRLASSSKLSVSMFGDLPVIAIRHDRLNELHWRLLKRAFDFISSLLFVFFIGSWFFPLITFLIKRDSKGPAIFVQDRIGKNGLLFKCYKFRTMRTETDDSVFVPASQKDKRITKIGEFLRKTNIDELPQVFNVLFGSMSVVGPRPHPVAFEENYLQFVEYIKLRNLVKPGLTGWAQANGYRGDVADYERNQILIKNRIKHDIWYIENWTFWLDIQIIVMTFWGMVSGKNKGI